MKAVLEKLFAHQSLSQAEAYETMCALGRGEVNDAHASAFMTVYNMRAITLEELRGFRNALLELSLPVAIDAQQATDLCGTGGDGRNTFNISTLAAFVVAGAGGRVVKHGNYGVSSVSGSSTVLENLGYQFTNSSSALASSLEKTGICFLHAPLFHPALKNVAEVRRKLGMRTVFNLLGPLVNPARPSHRLTGIFNTELLRKYHYLLQETDETYTLVHSSDGFDEISLTSTFRVTGRNEQRLYSPRELGLNVVQPSELYGGETPADAARVFVNIIEGRGTPAQNNVVCVNAATALLNLGIVKSMEEGIALAQETLRSRAALKTFKSFMEHTASLKANA